MQAGEKFQPMHARYSALYILFALLTRINLAAGQIPQPKDIFGFTPGDDYQLADYSQMLEYYQALDASTERVKMIEIGRSVLDKPLLLLFISSKENIERLNEYKEINKQLALGEVDRDIAEELAKEGKSIVWVDGGLHATEVACAQMMTLLAHRVAAEESDEMKAIRDNVILLHMPIMNPDGLDIIANWYRKNRNTPFETTRPPWLYHHYVGHDNNRDWFMCNMPESKAVNQVLYNEWYPQIVYNHHQTGPSWTRIFIPPFADPVNPNIHPGVTTGVNMIGTSMANRFAMEKMPGAVSTVIYSMWWNGGMRTVPYFHNMIGILTETSHASATPRFYDPDSIPDRIAARRGSGHPTDGTNIFYPYPWKGGESTFEQPVAYMLTATMAVLRSAADLKQQWLLNMHQMATDAIEAGSADSVKAYVLPKDQAQYDEAINLVNILRLGGVEVHRAIAPFQIGDRFFEEGSFVIPTAQAFRNYIIDLLEKQEYPDRRVNGRPDPPYDIAGWTLPMQMDVEVFKALEEPSASTEQIFDLYQYRGLGLPSSPYYRISPGSNASILAINELMSTGVDVRLEDSDSPHYLVPSSTRLQSLARKYPLKIDEVTDLPSNKALKKPRVGLYKSWYASMDEGWTRWLLEEYQFDFDTLHDAQIRAGELDGFDVIVLPHQSAFRILQGHRPLLMPEPYTGGLGLDGTLALKRFVERGGRIVALDGATEYVMDQFGLPIRNALGNVSSSQFFIPGSLVKINVDTNTFIGNGMSSEAIASFVRSRAFERVKLSRKQEGGMTQIPEPPTPDMTVIARYAEDDILQSGWALGEDRYLSGKPAVVQVPFGEGDVILFGFRPQFRGQPRGTYKLFFNSLLETGIEDD